MGVSIGGFMIVGCVDPGVPMDEPSCVESAVLAELESIYEGRAKRRYGLSAVDQRTHALQSGAHARTLRLSAPMIVAALLHDIGHMVHELGEDPAARGVDDRHEDRGADWLARHFGAAVVQPVRLHVAAKRYLCTVAPAYAASLSADSVRSLALQGGPMDSREVLVFQAMPGWRDAVVLRRIDDLAKDPSGPTPAFASFRGEIIRALRDRDAVPA
jgi:predicted HD phosphohydrolase